MHVREKRTQTTTGSEKYWVQVFFLPLLLFASSSSSFFFLYKLCTLIIPASIYFTCKALCCTRCCIRGCIPQRKRSEYLIFHLLSLAADRVLLHCFSSGFVLWSVYLCGVKATFISLCP